MEIGAIKSRKTPIEFPQGASDVLPSLPVRALALGNSGSGKTNMIVTLITDRRFYLGRFERIYWLSPTATIDDALDPLRDYVEEELEQDQSADPMFHDRLDVPFLTRVVDRARRVMEYLKAQKPRPKKAFNTLIVIDDLANVSDNAALKLVSDLFIKARHWGISTILSTQKLRQPLVTQAVRVNATALFVWKLRNQHDLWDGLIYEYSALGSKDRLMAMYRAAVDKPFGFLYIRLNSQDPDHMFFSSFTGRFLVDDKDATRGSEDS
jgi:Poxvirus A32 protein.